MFVLTDIRVMAIIYCLEQGFRWSEYRLMQECYGLIGRENPPYPGMSAAFALSALPRSPASHANTNVSLLATATCDARFGAAGVSPVATPAAAKSPIAPSPFRSWLKVGSADSSTALVPDMAGI